MDEVALGEHSAARGNRRWLVGRRAQGRIIVRDAQPGRLLIQERAGARGTHGVGGVALEMPLLVELDQGERAAPDVDDARDFRKFGAHHGNLARRQVEPGQLERLAEAGAVRAAKPEGIARADPELGHGQLERLGRLAAVAGVERLGQRAVGG